MRGAITRQQAAEFRAAFTGEIDSLAALYRNAAADMMETVAAAAATASQKRRAVALLRQYQRQLAVLEDEAALWVELNIPRSYRIGIEFADSGIARIKRTGINMPRRASEVFAQVHTEAVAAAVAATVDPLSEMGRQIGRRVDDLFRKVGTEEVTKGIVEGKTRIDVSRAIEERLLADGRPYFTDKLGRRWEMDTYAEMVARTTTREAATQGTINRLREHGIGLAQVSASNAADFCIYYEGAIVSVNGPHPDYPPISAIDGGPPFHPNCVHVLTPFVERLATEQERERGKITDPTVLGQSPADLQKRFRREFPERARAEGQRLRQQAAHRAMLRARPPEVKARRREAAVKAAATRREREAERERIRQRAMARMEREKVAEEKALERLLRPRELVPAS